MFVVVAYTLEELAEIQRAANEAQARVAELRSAFGPPAIESWSDAQKTTHETAWRAWRDLERDLQDAVTEHAHDEGLDRAGVERAVHARARALRGDGST